MISTKQAIIPSSRHKVSKLIVTESLFCDDVNTVIIVLAPEQQRVSALMNVTNKNRRNNDTLFLTHTHQ